MYWASRLLADQGRPDQVMQENRKPTRQQAGSLCFVLRTEISCRGQQRTGQGQGNRAGQGRVPRLSTAAWAARWYQMRWTSTQFPPTPPVHSRLLPRPPHCRTVQYASVPRIHPLSPSPCLLPPQGSRVRSLALLLPTTTLLLLSLQPDRVLSSCTIFPFFLFIPTPPSRPLTLDLVFIIAVPPSA